MHGADGIRLDGDGDLGCGIWMWMHDLGVGLGDETRWMVVNYVFLWIVNEGL